MQHLKIEQVYELFDKEGNGWNAIQVQVESNLFTYSSIWDHVELKKQEDTVLMTGYIEKEAQEITFDLKELDDIVLYPFEVSILEFVFGKEKIILEIS